ncbi:hypothetical protein SLEP1_g56239 [Rubroshorea leprosula]|uniref:Leucine-rich repeat-containing N-terminal plant-type domain-containing protein n=1 Tax=Rubroshorea leprosula TaxID=152421 RepID=A0AAV5MKW2_9ROSI|nr:hypothetical protein SLEP1_g56239 [Rubroshorea leprosula]
MRIFTKPSAPLCLLFVFLCLKTAFPSSIHASSFSTTHLCSHEEALALLQFKTSFSINFTVSNPDYCANLFYTKPNYSKIESWKEGIDCCSWDGVSCDNVTGHVIALNLICSHLSGTFPSNSTLFLLKNLQSLNLAFNDFRLSKIPPEISTLVSLNLSNYYISSDLILETTTFKNLVHNLSEVRELVLNGVNMTSVNPRFFMNLSSSLTTLRLFNCQLRGNFPNNTFRFPNLKRFSLGGKGNLTIDLPSSNWSSPLQRLYLGSIPASIGNLSELTVLSLFSNNFNRQIPTSLANLTQLTSLYLSNNQFSGPIPTSLANLTQLTSLDLSNNQFSGPIPAFIGNLRQLTSLNLYSNNLGRQIPSSLANLTQLTSLDLFNNQFSGPIPASISNLRQLTGLHLDANNLSGQIPSSLANLTQLSYLSLSYNLLNTLPPWLFTLPFLESLYLNHNQLQVPNMFSALQNLEILDLSHNNLIGKIPNCLPKSLSALNLQANYFDGYIAFGFLESCGLRNLNLHGNQMDGLLPRSLVNCRMLEVLDVGNNNISDTFPHWLESLPDLQVLVLRSNKFHGSVQSTKESPSFPKLRVLDLSSNYFVGALPVQYIENFDAMMDPHKDGGSPEYMMVLTVANSYQYSLVVTWKGFDYELQKILTVFSSIHLSNNMFEGEIPDVIGKLSSLKGLNLSHNNLTGHIPPSLGNLTNLEWLDLSSNKLAGKIPDELVSLTQLSVLNLSNNHLIGRIPQGNQFNTFGNGSYEGNLGL